MDKIPMTVLGEASLKQELHQLKSVERPRIIQAIAEARAHGDLKENAEYHAAKERQSFTEARIRDIEYKLSRAHVINVAEIPNTGKIIFGVTVTLAHLETGEKMRYQIVGEDEADIAAGKISVLSPIARALIGKHLNDSVTVLTPAGKTEYDILNIEFK